MESGVKSSLNLYSRGPANVCNGYLVSANQGGERFCHIWHKNTHSVAGVQAYVEFERSDLNGAPQLQFQCSLGAGDEET